MPFGAIDNSHRSAAKLAGASYLISFALVVFAQFRIHDRLITHNPADTARNILAHQPLFRIGIACDLLSSAAIIVLLVALYIILAPVNRGVALLAALFRFIYAAVWILMSLNLFDALRLLTPDNSALSPQLAQADFYLSARFDQYYVALLFGAAASTLCCYLWLKSNYIPKALAAFGLAASAFCVACTIVFILDPAFDHAVSLWLFDTPMGIFDLVLSFWLLIRGLSPRAATN